MRWPAALVTGAVAVVEQALDEVGGGQEILQALLILDTDGLAAEVIGDAERGGVHFALEEDLLLRQIGGLVGAEVEFHALGAEPFVDGAGLEVGDLGDAVVEGGLREAFLVNAGGEEEFVGDDGVEHAHAAFVEDAHDGFFAAEVGGDFLRHGAGAGGDFALCQRLDMGRFVLHDAGLEPGGEVFQKGLVSKILAPEGGIFDSGFGQ